MLKTRQRFRHKDQSMTQSVDPQSDQIKPTTNPLALTLLIGLNNNNTKCCILDSDFTRSPKSPLEFKVLTTMADPFFFRSPRSSIISHLNCCGPVKVGLSIVNDRSLCPDVVFGPALKIKSCEIGDQNPKIEKERSRVVFEIGENRSEIEPIGFKNRSFSVMSRSKMGGEPYIALSRCLSEDEMSEDYTCIIAHGPNPKTTHIYGDRVLECHKNEFKEPKHVETEFDSMFMSDNFLSKCNFCNKKLKDGEDIYIYRGEKSFCSVECRSEEMMIDEENIEDSSITMHESLKKHF